MVVIRVVRWWFTAAAEEGGGGLWLLGFHEEEGD